MPDLLLDPWLDRNNDVKLNGFVDQKLDHLPAEEASIRSELYILYMTGQFLDHGLEKPNSMIRRMVLAASKKTSQIISGLSHKAQKGMVALSPLLFGVISKSGSLRIPINRGDVRIKIKGNAFKCLKTPSELHEKIKVKTGDLPGYTDPQRTKKTADSRLNRKRNQAGNALKYSIRAKNLHLPRSWITQKHCVQTTDQHVSNAIFALSSALYLDSVFNLFLDSVTLKKSPYKTASTKSGEILAAEFFFDNAFRLLAFDVFLRYILFHFLSASSIVLGISLATLYYNRWRHFCLKN
jgi:hypothetical protein